MGAPPATSNNGSNTPKMSMSSHYIQPNTLTCKNGTAPEKGHGESSSLPQPRDPIEATYASLVQQYLSLLLYENATFLAERMVAHRPTARAVYLLGVCHYRSGSPKRARSVILQYRGAEGGPSLDEKGGGGEKKEAGEEGLVDQQAVGDAATYLLAKCCLDLGLYTESEDCLLRDCRLKYRAFVSSNGSGSAIGGGNSNTMDEWILQTTPCPVPNGAAGLSLLGKLYSLSHRKRRAVDYYRMSLKLDPMLWSSYEALCEMGAADFHLDDPATVFGVVPHQLLTIPSSNGGYGPTNKNAMGIGMDGKTIDEEDAANQSPSFSISGTPTLGGVAYDSINANYETAVQQQPGKSKSKLNSQSDLHPTYNTPFSASRNTLDMAALEDDATNTFDQSYHRQSHLPAASLFNTGSRYPPSATATETARKIPASTTMPPPSSRHSGNLPSTALFNTPNLTPIHRRNKLHQAHSHLQHPNNNHNHDDNNNRNSIINSINLSLNHSSQSVNHRYSPPPTFSSKKVISRAHQVATRLYYEPSPEITPPTFHTNDVPHSSLKLTRVGKYRRNRRLSGLAFLEENHAETSIATGTTTTDAEDTEFMTSNNESIMSQEEEDEEHHSSRTKSHLSFSNCSDMDDIKSVIGTNNDNRIENRVLFGQTMDPAVAENKASAAATAESNAVKWRTGLLQNNESKLFLQEEEENLSQKQTYQPCKMMGENQAISELDGVQSILELLCMLGAAQRLLCQYRCKEALHIFHSALPHSQFNTGFVLHQVGRAYFEMADYQNAQQALESMQRVEPHRMKGLEVLSTTLWHLKKDVELSNLAQRAVDFDKKSSESWCVVGNCFSLQKEHEIALTFFRRSIQLDPTFTYSHTLSGHEYVSNEDFDKAIACFRDAIRSDDRHYNAWYGLGAIYFRQEKYDLAEYHFQRALAINAQSSVLHCHLGMAQHANGKPYEALETLAGAFRLDPRNPQARYQRATIWMAMDKPREALVELEKVRDAAPREASVHFAIGRVLKRLGRPEKAMRCFLTALDLDPKDNNLIKAAMDRLDEPDVDEDVSAF